MTNDENAQDVELGAALGDAIARIDVEAPVPSSGKQTANTACRLLVECAHRLTLV
jgi:hypothetical protein